MKRRSEDSISQIQPLPGDFSPAMRELDSRLTQSARQTPASAGLVERVFEASASLLPEHQTSDAAASRWRLIPTVPGRALQLHRLAWGRVAMAASVLIACGIAVWFLEHAPASAPGLAGKTSAGPDVHPNLNLNLSWIADDSTV